MTDYKDLARKLNEDAEGWRNAAKPHTGRTFFAYNGAGRMMENAAAAILELVRVIEGAEEYVVYYRTRLLDDESLWVESKDPREVVERSGNRAVYFEKLTISKITSGWEPWNPEETS